MDGRTSRHAPPRRRRLLSRMNALVLGLCPIIALAVLWQLVAMYGGLSHALLPTFTSTASRFVSLIGNGTLLSDLWVTVEQGAVGLAIALVAGILVGLVMSRVAIVRWFFDPVIAIGLPTPTIMLLPAFLVWFGVGNWSKILLVGLTCFFPVALSAYSGAQSVDERMIWSARSMGTSGRRLISRIILPGSLSYIFAGARVAVPLAVIITILSEMIAGGGGLGYRLTNSYRLLNSQTEYATLIAILIFGYLIDRLLLLSLHTFAPWADSDDDGNR